MRAQFQLDPDLAHFAAFVFASHPAPVARAIQEHRDALDRDTDGYLETGTERENAVRTALAGKLDVPATEIALTDSTTMGLGLLYGGMELGPGDEILTTTHDFYSTNESLALAAKRTDARVQQVTLYDEPAQADADQIVDRLSSGLTDRTRIVAITWVHSGTGVRLPVSQIAEAVDSANEGRAPADRALLCVDGVHGFGLIAMSMPDLGCDFFSAGTHKWLMGPRGTGLVWGNAWDRVDTTIPTFSAPHFAPGPHATPGGFHSFEHRWAVPEALDFHAAIGADSDRGAHAHPGHAAEGGTGRHRWRHGRHADVARPVGGDRLPPDRQHSAMGRRAQAAGRPRRRRERHSLQRAVPASRPEHRDQSRRGRSRDRRGGRDRRGLAPVRMALVEG